jgi:hypothetical protein
MEAAHEQLPPGVGFDISTADLARLAGATMITIAVLPFDCAAWDAVELLGRGLPGSGRLSRRCVMPLGCTNMSIVAWPAAGSAA